MYGDILVHNYQKWRIKVEEIFKKNSIPPKELNELIKQYKKEGDNYLLSLIIGRFINQIEYDIYKKLLYHDNDIKNDIYYEICKWIDKDNIKNYYGYIKSNIHFYIKNYVNRNIHYPELSERQIKDYLRISGNKHDKKNVSDREASRLRKIESLIVSNSLNNFDLVDTMNIEHKQEDTEYRYSHVLKVLNSEELELLNKYYTNKKTLVQIGLEVGKSKDTVRRELLKIKKKLEKEM